MLLWGQSVPGTERGSSPIMQLGHVTMDRVLSVGTTFSPSLVCPRNLSSAVRGGLEAGSGRPPSCCGGHGGFPAGRSSLCEAVVVPVPRAATAERGRSLGSLVVLRGPPATWTGTRQPLLTPPRGLALSPPCPRAGSGLVLGLVQWPRVIPAGSRGRTWCVRNRFQHEQA